MLCPSPGLGQGLAQTSPLDPAACRTLLLRWTKHRSTCEPHKPQPAPPPWVLPWGYHRDQARDPGVRLKTSPPLKPQGPSVTQPRYFSATISLVFLSPTPPSGSVLSPEDRTGPLPAPLSGLPFAASIWRGPGLLTEPGHSEGLITPGRTCSQTPSELTFLLFKWGTRGLEACPGSNHGRAEA